MTPNYIEYSIDNLDSTQEQPVEVREKEKEKVGRE